MENNNIIEEEKINIVKKELDEAKSDAKYFKQHLAGSIVPQQHLAGSIASRWLHSPSSQRGCGATLQDVSKWNGNGCQSPHVGSTAHKIRFARLGTMEPAQVIADKLIKKMTQPQALKILKSGRKE